MLHVHHLLATMRCTLFAFFVPCDSFVRQPAKSIDLHLTAVTFVRHSSHTVESPHLSKPSLLYLPGLDGGISNYTTLCLDTLSVKYECWRMIVSPTDRTNFLGTSSAIQRHLRQNVRAPTILLAESFGAMLGLHVAANEAVSRRIDRLVLANPATSFDRTTWQPYIAALTRAGAWYPYLGLTTLIATGVQPAQILKLARQVQSRIASISDAARELRSIVSVAGSLSGYLPADTLQWRIKQWLDVGSHLLESCNVYERVQVPVLLLMGGADRMLPSGTEGRRLKKRLRNAAVTVRDFPDRGHALLDGTLDVRAFIDEQEQAEKRTIEQATVGNATGARNPYPSDADLQRIQPILDTLYTTTSPVFYSRNASGDLVVGLDCVPTGSAGRPVLLVGNHQLLGLDLPILVAEFLREKGTLIRGLAHPVAFRDRDGRPLNSSLSALFTAFGAVPVSPMAYYELLRANATILLFPGGAQEAFHTKNNKYKLAWPEKTDFVRMAVAMDALIVPFAAIGMADSVQYILDDENYQRIPWLYAAAQRYASKRAPRARPDVAETVMPPIVAPALPSRCYFLFQLAIDTRSCVNRTKAGYRDLYFSVRDQVESGIEELQQIQESDRYASFIPRLGYEILMGRRAPAPRDRNTAR